jgi:hypothetical protein
MAPCVAQGALARTEAQKLRVTGRKLGAGAPAPDPNTWYILPVPLGIDDRDDEVDLTVPN